MMKDPREITKEMFELLDEGCLDETQFIHNLLNWMSEDDVREFAEHHEYITKTEET